jgi:hypothetical protein
MTPSTGASETWQARISHDLAAQLRRDAEVLGLGGRTEILGWRNSTATRIHRGSRHRQLASLGQQ